MSEAPDRTAVVTGATGGIGGAVARAWAVLDGRLWVLGRRRGALKGFVEKLPGPALARGLSGDLTSERYQDEVTEVIRRACEGLDLLVHAAGVYSSTGLARFDQDEYRRLFDLNVRARFALTARLLPLLRARGGTVVFVNSSVGSRSPATSGVYAASMHAMRAGTDALRQEVNPHGVRVVSVFLGRTATPMQGRIHREEGRAFEPEYMIRPETVGRLIVDLAGLPRDAEVTDVMLRPIRKPQDRPDEEPDPPRRPRPS